MDNTFWATVALVLFFALVVYLKGFRRINASLDDRAKRIQTELEEARELKEEAKQQLAVMREEGPLLAGMQAAMADNDYGALKKARQARETTIREFGNIPPSRSVL